jgi:hypothetical protein
MFLRSTKWRQDVKNHRISESSRTGAFAEGKTVQRSVLYLGEINDQQQAAWRRHIVSAHPRWQHGSDTIRQVR